MANRFQRALKAILPRLRPQRRPEYELQQLDTARRKARAQRTPSGQGGLQDRYQMAAIEGQFPETSFDELLERYAVQPGLRAPIDKVAKIVGTCKATVQLRPGFSEMPEQRKYLETLLQNPGADSFSNIIFETVVRLKVNGECAWEWIFPDQARLDAARPTAVKSIMGALAMRESDPEAPATARVARRKANAIVDGVIAQLARMPVGFRVLQGTINPMVDKHGWFTDPSAAFTQIVCTGDRQTFGIDELLWMRGPNPVGGAHALPPFESIRFIDDIDEKMYVYQDAVLNNRGELGGVVTIKNPAPGELTRVRNEMDNKHRGPENAGKWYVIGVDGDGDTKVQPFGIEPIKMEPEQSAMRRLQLMWSVINVPGAKIGFTSEVNRSNIEMQDKALMEEEILPICKLVAEPFNRYLRRVGIQAYDLVFSQADLRTESDKIKQRRAKMGLGLITLNDLLREEVGEKAVVKGGDVRIVELDKFTIIFSEDKEPHLVMPSGTMVPLFTTQVAQVNGNPAGGASNGSPDDNSARGSNGKKAILAD